MTRANSQLSALDLVVSYLVLDTLFTLLDLRSTDVIRREFSDAVNELQCIEAEGERVPDYGSKEAELVNVARHAGFGTVVYSYSPDARATGLRGVRVFFARADDPAAFTGDTPRYQVLHVVPTYLMFGPFAQFAVRVALLRGAALWYGKTQ